MRYLIVNKYYVRPDRLQDFLAAYRPDGLRTRLLRTADGYLWTSLSRTVKERCAWVSLDVWRSQADLEKFQADHAADCANFAATCATFMEETVSVFAGEALPGR